MTVYTNVAIFNHKLPLDFATKMIATLQGYWIHSGCRLQRYHAHKKIVGFVINDALAFGREDTQNGTASSLPPLANASEDFRFDMDANGKSSLVISGGRPAQTTLEIQRGFVGASDGLNDSGSGGTISLSFSVVPKCSLDDNGGATAKVSFAPLSHLLKFDVCAPLDGTSKFDEIAIRTVKKMLTTNLLHSTTCSLAMLRPGVLSHRVLFMKKSLRPSTKS